MAFLAGGPPGVLRVSPQPLMPRQFHILSTVRGQHLTQPACQWLLRAAWQELGGPPCRV